MPLSAKMAQTLFASSVRKGVTKTKTLRDRMIVRLSPRLTSRGRNQFIRIRFRAELKRCATAVHSSSQNSPVSLGGIPICYICTAWHRHCLKSCRSHITSGTRRCRKSKRHDFEAPSHSDDTPVGFQECSSIERSGSTILNHARGEKNTEEHFD